MFDSDPRPLAVELMVAPQSTLIEVACVVEPLRAANRMLGRAQFSWVITTPDGAPAPTQAGVPIPAARAFDPQASADPLFVIGSYAIAEAMSPGLIRRLGQAARVRPVIVGIEAGAWLIARAGLLTGRRATTHWEDLDAFAAAFPDIAVTAARVVRDGNRVTTGGAGAALDLMLELIRLRLGYALSREVARLFIYEPPPTAAAAGLILARPREPRLARAVETMEAHLDDPVPVARLARLVGVSPRQLQTLFHAGFGVGPRTHYLSLRLNRARRLLLETRAPVLDIAAATGFATPASFARAYRRLHGESPTRTRAAAAAS